MSLLRRARPVSLLAAGCRAEIENTTASIWWWGLARSHEHADAACGWSRPPLRRSPGGGPPLVCRRRAARCWASSARTAPARRRPCACWRRSTCRSRATRSSAATRSSQQPREVREDHRLHAGLCRRLRTHDRRGVPRLLRSQLRAARAGAARRRRQHHRLHGAGRPAASLRRTLSKGLNQRVALGRAIIHNPQLLILDEPAANLDPRARIEFRTLIRELAADGKTIVLSSHILTELTEMCDTVAVIEKGRMLATGTVQEILEGLRPRRLLSLRVAHDAGAAAAISARAAGCVARARRRPATSVSSSTATTRDRRRCSDAWSPPDFRFSSSPPTPPTSRTPSSKSRSDACHERAVWHRCTISLEEAATRPEATSRAATLLGRLDDASDRLSPLVVKEVRQFVRGRDFSRRSAVGLVVGMLISFVSSIEAMGGVGTTGQCSVHALTACLSLLGLAVVPLGAFAALRTERLEQTLDLISLTTLSPRRSSSASSWRRSSSSSPSLRRWRHSWRRAFCSAASISSPSSALWPCCFSVGVGGAAALLVSTAFKSRGVSGALLAGGAFLVFHFRRGPPAPEQDHLRAGEW